MLWLLLHRFSQAATCRNSNDENHALVRAKHGERIFTASAERIAHIDSIISDVARSFHTELMLDASRPDATLPQVVRCVINAQTLGN